MKKIIVALLIVAILAAGGYYAKTEYDRWHAAQPWPLGFDVLQALIEAIPEAELQSDMLGENNLAVSEDGSRTLLTQNKQGTYVGAIELAVKEYNLLKKPLYEVADVHGLLSVDLVSADEESFTVHDGGYGYTVGEPKAPLFEDDLYSVLCGGLFSPAQILPANGHEVKWAQTDKAFLTVPDGDGSAPAIRAALSRGLVLQRDEEGETVFSLLMTEPLVLSEAKAVVFARCTSGESEDASWTTDGCYLLEKQKDGSWSLTAEEPDQSAVLPYTAEEIYEIPQYVLPPEGRALSHAYYIMVNRQMNTVTVYTKDDEGKFTVPYKAMICSTGRAGHETPTGNFAVMSFKAPWCYMVDGSYGQYATGFLEGGYLFHTICYTAKDKSTMMRDEYNMLGDFASAGCVRLQTADAKWIYDNCEVGTGVTVYDGPEAGPLGKPEKAVAEITDANDNGWDPTDPDPDNPWYRGN